MKTVVIWDDLAAPPVKFFVVEGDYRHLDGVYTYSSDPNKERYREVMALIFKPDSVDYAHESLEHFPIDQLQPNDAVILIGRFVYDFRSVVRLKLK